MMLKLFAVVRSMRLRTLPLSLAGVMLGAMLAAADYRVSAMTVLLLLLTTVCLQVLSNLANELGDVLHGADAEGREGARCGGLDLGLLSVREMRALIALFVLLCVVSGAGMVYVSFGTLLSIESICLLLLGAAAIMAALKYTLGNNPYGYRGLGDVYVFMFFGPVAVMGAYFVCAHAVHSFLLLLPAVAIGFFSVGVLNVNNIRDVKEDESTRVTVAMRLGERWARIYQTLLLVAGFLCMTVYSLCRFFDIWHYLFLLSLPLFVLHLAGVWRREGKDLDAMLPLLVAGTFVFSLLAGLGYLLFLLR